MSSSPSSKGLLTTAARSRLMQQVGRKDTAPEFTVRRYLHACGLRFRVNDRRLPGTPDLVLPRRRSVVFVHGCFWHGHHCAHGSVQAKSNWSYWRAKIDDNRARDRRKEEQLRGLGWRVETIWQCECGDPGLLRRLAVRLLRR